MRICVLLILLFLIPTSVLAQVPGDPCAGLPAGATRLVEDNNLDYRDVIIICDGSNWQTMQFAIDRIQDTDNDTFIDVDTANDDIIRMTAIAKPVSSVFSAGSNTTFRLTSAAANPNLGIYLEENGSNSAYIGLDQASGDYVVNAISAGADIVFRRGGTEYGRIYDTGEIVLNSSDPPQADLDINGWLRSYGVLQDDTYTAYILNNSDYFQVRAGNITNSDTMFYAYGLTGEYIRIGTYDDTNPSEIVIGDDHLYIDQVNDRVGINSATPNATLDVSDIIIVGTTSQACGSAQVGGLRYNATERCMEVCAGAGWGCNTEVQCPDNIPDAFSFTDISNAAVNTVVESEIVQITGLAQCSITVSIEGASGTPQYRVCNDATCTSVEHDWSSAVNGFANNQYVQVRMTSTRLGQDTRTLSIRVGARATSWSVTTAGACPPDASPVVGSLCADGSVYVGSTTDSGGSNYHLYSTPCRLPRVYEDGGCTGIATTMPYNNDSTNYTWVGANNTNDGQQNTTSLVSEDPATNLEAPYFAATYCNNLGDISEPYAYGYTDWYLPAQNEINAICPVFNNIGLDWGSTHWASTETSTDRARYERSDCYSSHANKRNKYVVRCVRRVLQ